MNTLHKKAGAYYSSRPFPQIVCYPQRHANLVISASFDACIAQGFGMYAPPANTKFICVNLTLYTGLFLVRKALI